MTFVDQRRFELLTSPVRAVRSPFTPTHENDASSITAGQSAISRPVHLHLLTLISGSDVGDLLGPGGGRRRRSS